MWLFNAVSTTCSLAGDGSTLWEHDGGPFCLANGLTHIFVCFETIPPRVSGTLASLWLVQDRAHRPSESPLLDVSEL